MRPWISSRFIGRDPHLASRLPLASRGLRMAHDLPVPLEALHLNRPENGEPPPGSPRFTKLVNHFVNPPVHMVHESAISYLKPR